MDRDYLYIHARIAEAQRLRNEMVGEMIATACYRAVDLIGRGLTRLSDALRPRRHAHH